MAKRLYACLSLCFILKYVEDFFRLKFVSEDLQTYVNFFEKYFDRILIYELHVKLTRPRPNYE